MDTINYTVYIFLSEDCPICRYYVPDLNQLYTTYRSEKISFVGVFPNFSSKPHKIDKFKTEYGFLLPTKTDYFKQLSKQLNATKTPEVFVVNSQNELIYKGRIDNAYAALGKRRRVVNDKNLDQLLLSIMIGKDTPYTETESIGCFINYVDFKL